MTGFSLGYSNFSIIFLDNFALLIVFIPIRLYKPVRFLLVILSLTVILGFGYLLEPKRVFEGFERSIRAASFHGFNIVVNYMIQLPLKWIVLAYFILSA